MTRCSLRNKRIGTILKSLKQFFVLEIDKNRAWFHLAKMRNFLHNFISCHRSVCFKELHEYIFDKTRLISPFTQRVESAAYEHKTVVFDKLVVNRLNMYRMAGKFLNAMCDLAEMEGLMRPRKHNKRAFPHTARPHKR